MPDDSSFDTVYSISDLHLGGAPGFQIFDQGSLLAETIASMPAPKRRVALVINGDFVDFLAEPVPAYFDPKGALKKLARIAADTAFAPVFQALAGFVRTSGCTLVVTLGNHDVELALPACRSWLLDTLAGPDPAARDRLRFALDGAGFTATLGRYRAYFVHGNEVDDWNVVDHEGIRRTVVALERGGALPDMRTNAGTKLVLDVMNDVKRSHPFVDVLKPETVPVGLILLALDPAAAGRKLPGVVSTWLKKTGTAALRAVGLLSRREDDGEFELTEEEAASLLAANLRPEGSAGDLLALTERRFQAGERVLTCPTEGGVQTLGSGAPGLREALKAYMDRDRSLKIDEPDDTITKLEPLVGPGIDVVIAGHTHLRRALRRSSGRVYLNTGTWARLLKLGPEVLGSDAAFAAFRTALDRRDTHALERFLTREPTLAVLHLDNRGRLSARLEAAVPGERSVVASLDIPPKGRP